MAIQFLNDQYISGTLQVAGAVTFDTAVNPGSDTDKIAVFNGSVLGFRTTAQILSDLGGVTAVTGTQPIISSGGTTPAISLNYTGANNVVESATDLEGTAIALLDSIIYNDVTDGNVKKGLISDLPYSATTGTVTSITPGADSGTGTAITTSGTITVAGGSNITTSVSGTTITVNTDFNQYGWSATDGSTTNSIPSGTTVTWQGGTGINVSLNGYILDISVDGTAPTGSGSTNSVTKWTSSTALGDGPITFATNDSTFAGNVEVNGTTIDLDSAASASYIADRANDTSGATYEYKTAGALKWYTGLRGLSNDNFYIFNNGTSVNTLILDLGTDAATFAGTVKATDSLKVNTVSATGDPFVGFYQNDTEKAYIQYVDTGDNLLVQTDGQFQIKTNSSVIALTLYTDQDAEFANKVGIGMTPAELLDIVSASGDARIRLDAPAASDTEIKFYNAGVAQYTIGHDDATDNFVIGGANVDAALVSIDKTGDATFAGNVTLGSSTKASDEWMYIDSDGSNSAGIQLLRAGLSKWFIYNPGGGNNFKIYDNSGGGYMEMAVGGNATFSADILTNTDSSSDIGKTATRWANIWVDLINGGIPTTGGPYLPLTGGTLTGDSALSTAGTATFTIESSGANGNNVYLALASSDTEWRWTTNRGDQISGNQGDLFLREDTAGVNALIFETNTGNATFAGTITATTNGSTFGNISVDKINLGDNEKVIWGGGSDLQIYHQSSDNTSYIFANNTNPLKIATETSATPITIGHTTSEVTIGDNLTVNGTSTLKGDATVYNGLYPDADLGAELGTGSLQFSTINVQTSKLSDNVYMGGGQLYIGTNLSSNIAATENSYRMQVGGGIFTLAKYVGASGSGTWTGQLTVANDGTVQVANKATSTATTSGDGSTTLTTKGYIDGLITGATIYQGTWDPDVSLNSGYGNPNLNSVTKTNGYYYVCSADGIAEPNGTGTEPDSWHTGDWVIYNDHTGSGLWQKIDNTSVLSGVGTGQTVAMWDGASSVTDSETLTNAPLTFSTNDATFAGTLYAPGIQSTSYVEAATLLYGGNGVEGAPSHTFSSDANTGMYRKSADTIGFATGGSLALTIANNDAIFTGSVAVAGSNAPEKKLSINSAQSNGIQFNYDNSNNYRNQILNYWNSSADSRMDFNIARTSGETPVTIMSVGYNSNVGIGTSTPNVRAEIAASVNGNPLTSGTTQTYGALRVRGSATNVLDIGQQSASPYGMWMQVCDSTSLGTEYPLILNPNGGNVGIGTDNPGFGKVQIKTASAIGYTPTSFMSGTNLRLTTGGTAAASITTGISMGIGGAAEAYIGAVQNVSTYADIVFQTYHGAYGERMRITSVGKVGIATTAPQNTLHVVGNTRLAQSTTTEQALNAGTMLEVRGDAIGSGVVDVDYFKGFKLALNDATEWGGQAQFSLGRWEENGTNARSSLVISLGHGGINSATNADVDVMTLLSSGNVGIGTDDPSVRLHIQTETAPSDIYLTDGTVGTDNYGGVIRGFSTTGQGGRLQLGTLDNDIYYPALTILEQGGNVGIGTTDPQTLLHSAPGADTDGIQVGGTTSNRLLISDREITLQRSNTSTIGLKLITKNDGSWGASGDAGDIVFEPSETEAMRLAVGGDATFEGDITITKDKWLNIDTTWGARPAFGGTDDATTYARTIIRSIDNSANAGIDFQNYAGSSVVRILDGGNVGIGDSSPQGKLEVNNRNTATGAALFIKGGEDDLDPVAGQYTGLAFGYGGGDIYNNASILWEFTNTAANGKLHFAVNPTGADGTANLSDSKMTILDSGNVGIGTVTPDKKVHIEGGAAVTGAFYDSSTVLIVEDTNPYLQIIGTDGGNQASTLMLTTVPAAGSGNNKHWAIQHRGTTQSGNFGISYDTTSASGQDGADGTDLFVIETGGDVGIGTTSPAAHLQIEKASGTTLALSNSASVTSGIRGELAIYNSAVSTCATIKATAVTDNVGTSLNFFTRPAGGSLTETFTLESDGSATFAGGVGVEKNVYQIESSGATRGLYSMRPWGGDYFTQTASVTGALAITLPATTNVDDMLKFTIEIYQYAEQESCLVHVGGYLTSSLNWGNVSATVIASGGHDQNYTVRFGNDGSNYVVWIGETTTVWAYPQVIIRDFFAGYGAVSGDVYLDEWGVDFVTSGQTISKTLTNNFPMSSGGTDDTYWTGSGNDIYNDNSGNVGIGTITPNAKLDVNGEVVISPNTDGKDTFKFTTNASNDGRLYIKSDTTNNVDIQANGFSYFNGGDVAIGQTSAYTDGRLTVAESVNIDSAIVMNNQYNGSLASASLYLATYGLTWGVMAGSNTNEAGALRFVLNPEGGSPVEKMRITTGGDLQVGTGSSSIAMGDADDYNGTSRLKFIGSNSVTNWQISHNDTISGALEFMPSTAAGGTTFTTPAMLISSGGNVGIGVTGSSRKVDIRDTSNSQNTVLAYNQGASFTGTVYEAITDRTSNSAFNLMNLKSSTTSMFLVRGDGNVGIGTTSPSYPLVVSNGGAGGIEFVPAALTGMQEILSYNRSGAAYEKLRFSTLSYEFYTSAVSNALVILNGGNVGIGDTAPPEQFCIKDPSGGFRLEMSADNNPVTIMSDNLTGAAYGEMAFLAGNGSGANDITRMLIDSSGNVGIGTTSPTAKLTIDNSISTTYSTTGYAATPANSMLYLNNTHGGSNTASLINFRAGSGDGVLGFVEGGGTNDADFIIQTDGGSNGIERFRILNNGNVGIGTGTPTYKLEVDGTLYTEKGSVMGSLTDTTENNPALTLNIKSGSENLRLADTDTTTSFGPYISFWDLSAGVRRGFISCSGGQSSGRYDMKVVAEYGEVQLWTGASNNEAKRVTVDTSGNVGIGVAEPVAKVDAKSTDAYDVTSHGVKAGRMQYSWYNGQYFSNNDAYVHMKTNLWMGGSPAGNTEYLMGGFTAKSFSYSADGYGEGSCMFHNWAGTFPNLNVTNRGDWATFMQSPYTSTDGYCVIVLRHNYYSSPIIDFQQSYNGYPWREVAVTAAITDANATGVY